MPQHISIASGWNEGELVNNLITRDQWEARMNTGSRARPVWSLVGEGFTSLAEDKKPKEYSYQHFDEPWEYVDVVGYSPSLAFSVDVHSGDPVVSELMYIADHELVGADARREIIIINKWDPIAPGIYRAYRRQYSIISAARADHAGVMTCSGTMRACGRLEIGAFDSSTNQFFTEVRSCE